MRPERGVALSDLTHEDLLVYQHFLADPLPAERWVMAPGTKAGTDFAGMSAIRRPARTVKSTPGAVDPERPAVLAGGGGLSCRQPTGPQPPQAKARCASGEPILVNGTLDCQVHNRSDARHNRQRPAACLTLPLAVLVALPRRFTCFGDLRAVPWAGFFGRRGADSRERWWLEVTGKGGKTRLVPATGELMAELVRYRRAIGLSPLPQEGEAVPLVVLIIGAAKPVARSAIQ